MKTEWFTRKPFNVEGVRVTAANMADVAKWCDGKIKTQPASGNKPAANYIEVNVIRPMSPKQTMAFVGNWVLKVGASYKIYTDNAFNDTFTPLVTAGK